MRPKRICWTVTEFQKQSLKLMKKFLERGYKANVIKNNKPHFIVAKSENQKIYYDISQPQLRKHISFNTFNGMYFMQNTICRKGRNFHQSTLNKQRLGISDPNTLPACSHLSKAIITLSATPNTPLYKQ